MVDRGTIIFGGLRTFTLVLENELKKEMNVADRTVWVLIAHVVRTIFHMRWVANNEIWIANNKCIVVSHLGNILKIVVGESVIFIISYNNLKISYIYYGLYLIINGMLSTVWDFRTMLGLFLVSQELIFYGLFIHS